MEQHEVIFEALPEDKFRKKRNRKILLSGVLLIFALAYLVLNGVHGGDTMDIFGGVIFTIVYGWMLWDNYHVKPVTIKISSTGVWMQRPESELNVAWKEVRNAVYNDRYLDLFIQSSIRETLDLQPFSPEARAEILNLIDNYISGQSLSIKYMGVKKEAFISSA